MKNTLNLLKKIAARVWTHASAGVALLLIIGALVLGYRMGNNGAPPPAAQPAAHEHADEHEPATQYYTCSMHPSVRLTDPDAKCPICGMDLIPAGAEAANPDVLEISREAAEASRVETAEVARYFPRAAVRLYGKVTYDETSVARLTAYFPGRIDRLFVNYVGVSVSKGDHLAEVYSPELLAAFEELRQAAAAIHGSSSMSDIIRDATHDTLVAAREKLRLFGLTQQQIESVEDGSFDSDRFTVYAPIGGVVTHLGVREGDYVQTGAPIATVADLSRLWINMEAYESQLPLLRWGQHVSFTVEAHPGQEFHGRISFIEPIVNENTRTAAVRVAVDNTGGLLKPGEFASAVVHVMVGEHGALPVEDLDGEWVCPMHPSQVSKGPASCLVCGMEMVSTATLGVVDQPADLTPPIVIPKTAVLFTGTRSIVYVQLPDTQAPAYEAREVVLGPRAGDVYIVRRGLEEGERVVVNGAFRIDSAMQIAAKPSMMSPQGGAPAPGHAGMPGMADMPEKPAPAGNSTFVEQLTPVYNAYLDAQRALAGDDLAAFKAAAADLGSALGALRETGLVGGDVAVWRKAKANLRVTQDPATIDDARADFDRMSRGVIALLKSFGPPPGEPLNLAHCPMAFDFRGADWVQHGDEVHNPYFGAEMLTCGSIRETFRAGGAAPQSGTGGGTHE